MPLFENEDEERDFWAKNSPLDFMDVPYQSLVKLYLGREILMERRALESS